MGRDGRLGKLRGGAASWTHPCCRESALSLKFRFALLFATQFGALGVILPFLPAVLHGHGLTPEQVAMVLALGSATRLLASPLLGRTADALGEPRRLLALAALLAGVAAAGFALAGSFGLLLLVALLHNLAVAPVPSLTDALAIAAARDGRFDYGRVRSAGSIAFIGGAVLAGQAVGMAGPAAAVWLFSIGLVVTAWAAMQLPPAPLAPRGQAGGFAAPFRIPAFRRLLPLSSLIQSSHALYYGFATIHWQAAGHSPFVIGLLWAEGVVAEVALFLWGRPLLERIGAAGMAALAAAAGLLRWAVTAETTWLPALALVQLLHAATFGAQHLAAMRVLQGLPVGMGATAQTLHSSIGVGLASGLITLASGPLYAAWGGRAFWAVAALCAVALPLTLSLRASLRAARPA